MLWYLQCGWLELNTLWFVSRIKEDHVIQHGLVVDGASLSLALRGHEKLFMEVCKNCSAVLCCRMAPLQKAKVAAQWLRITHSNQPSYRPLPSCSLDYKWKCLVWVFNRWNQNFSVCTHWVKGWLTLLRPGGASLKNISRETHHLSYWGWSQWCQYDTRSPCGDR